MPLIYFYLILRYLILNIILPLYPFKNNYYSKIKSKMSNNKFPTLYNTDTKGKTRMWKIWVRGDTYYTETGLLDGKHINHERTCEAKNVGRSNATTPEEQARKEATAKWKDQQIKKCYTQTLPKSTNSEETKNDNSNDGVKFDDSEDDDEDEKEIKSVKDIKGTNKEEEKKSIDIYDSEEDEKEEDKKSIGIYDAMLASKWENEESKVKFPADAQPKLDGTRCLVYEEDGKIIPYSRQHKSVKMDTKLMLEECKRLLNSLPPGSCLDGEIYKHGKKFEDIISVVTRSKPKSNKGDNKETKDEPVNYCIYDFIDPKCKLLWSERRKILNDAISVAQGNDIKSNINKSNKSDNKDVKSDSNKDVKGNKDVKSDSNKDVKSDILISTKDVKNNKDVKSDILISSKDDSNKSDSKDVKIDILISSKGDSNKDVKSDSKQTVSTSVPESENKTSIVPELCSDLANNSNLKFRSLILVPTVEVKSSEEMNILLKKYVKEGYEGLMLRKKDGKYQPKKRSKALIKVKKFDDEEFEIIGANEGKGSRKGCVIWEVRDLEDDSITFNTTHGTDVKKMREYYENRDSYIGKMLTVRFQGRTKHGKPRFPVGVEIRDE